VALYGLRPRVVCLDAAYWGRALSAWIHATLGAVAVVPFNTKRCKDLSCLPPAWTATELGQRASIERFFGRLFRVFLLQPPPLAGWSAVTCAVALSFTATIIVALTARAVARPSGVRPTITPSRTVKWSRHPSVRGSKSRQNAPVSGLREARSVPLCRLQRQHVNARLASTVVPPCFSAIP
jgi:hypothetical protein